MYSQRQIEGRGRSNKNNSEEILSRRLARLEQEETSRAPQYSSSKLLNGRVTDASKKCSKAFAFLLASAFCTIPLTPHSWTVNLLRDIKENSSFFTFYIKLLRRQSIYMHRHKYNLKFFISYRSKQNKQTVADYLCIYKM